MENYGNDLFLSQEGCPSLDFTLLDRPSSSVVSAPGATAPLFPGENSFPSFDNFDGARVEPFDDRSFPGHRSYVSEVQKDAMRRNAITHPGLVQRQMHGVHDFFGQDNQQQNLSSGSWPGISSGGSHIQPQYFLSGVGNTGDSGAGNMPMKDTLWSNIQSSPSEMATGDGGFSSLQSSKSVDDNRFPNEAVAAPMANQVRNQLGSALQHPGDSQNLSSSFGNTIPINNGMIEHHVGAAQNTPYQNQYGRYVSQTLAGAAVNEAPHLDAFANQLPWKGPAQSTHDPQVRGPPRGGGMTELQLLRQQALQSKHEQALQSKQQQALRLQQQEALRVQQQEAMRVQQQEATRLQQQEAARVQQQGVMRMEQQEGMQQELTRGQQQETLRLQQQEVVRFKQQEAMRLQRQGLMRLQQQEAVRASQQESMQSQQYDAMWLRQHDAMQSQQQDAGQPQSLDVTPSQQQDATLWQQHEVMRPQQQVLWSKKQQWSQQGQGFESQQKQSAKPQQQKAWLSQQQEGWQTQQQQQQVLPSPQQQALRLALQSQQRQAWQTQQQQALRSQQQQQALRMQQQQALWTQQQQALQSEQQQGFQSQQQQASPFHQRQEIFVGQQTDQQLEHARPQFTSQEACTEFPGTSYSALLHGPDTPPSQPQLGEEPVLSELEDHTEAFPPANTQNFVWPTDGPLYYQGSSNNLSTVRNLVEQHKHSGSSPAEAACHSQADLSFSLAKNAETQSNLPEYQRGGLVSQPVGKPMLQADKMNVSGNEFRNNYPVHTRPLAQSLQYGGEQAVHGLDNGRNQTNLLSQSQQHFQELQLSQQRSWESLAQKQAAFKPSFSEGNHSLSQSILTPESSTSQGEIQKNLSNFGARGNDAFLFGRTQTDGAACYYSHQTSNAKHDIWSNKAAQQATHTGQNSFSSVPPSDSSRIVFRNNPSTSLEARVPLSKMVGHSSLSNQESLRLNQEPGWKENDRALVSEQTTLPFPESDRFSHGFWKRHASLQESVGGLDTMCEPLKKVGTGSIWNHSLQQEKLGLEGQLDVQAASSIPNSVGGHANAGQGTHETRFLGQEGVSQQMQKHAGSQNFTDSVNVFSGETATMVLKENDDNRVYSSKMSVETQGSPVEEQRTFQQHMDPSATNVSLAHLRHSRPSSPLSPQHVKLGLGPSSLPQITQQVGTAGARMSPLRDGLVRKGSTSNMEGNKYGASSGVQLNGMLLQNNGRPSSALSNSSSLSKESAESEAFAPSSIASAHLERSKTFQGNVKYGGNSLYGSEHLQTSASSFEEEPSAGLHGKVLSVSEPSKQRFHGGENSEGKLSTVYQQPNNESTTLRVLQNQQIINMALKQLGNRAQAANLAGLLTTLKTSLSETSKNSGGRETFSPGNVEFSSTPEGGNSTQAMQRPQMVSREPITGNVDCSPPKFRAGNQSVLAEHNNHLIVNQEVSHTSEVSGSASTSLLADLQRQRRQSLSLMNGNRSHLLHPGGHCTNEGEVLGSKTLNLAPSQADLQMRGSESSFAFPGQNQFLQHQRSIIEGSLLHQTLKEPTPGTVWAAALPKSAVKAVSKPSEAVQKSLDSLPVHGYLPKVSLGQQDDAALVANQKFKSLMDLKEMLQQTASDSQYLNQRGLQLVNASQAGHGQLTVPIAKNVVNAIPSTHTAADLGLEGDVEALHKIRLNSGISNDPILPSQELRHDDSSPRGRLISSYRQAQPIAFGDRDAQVSVEKKDPVFKVEEARPEINVGVAASNQSSQHQVSPSKTSSHGVAAVHPKKRKKPLPLLIPWHIAAAQPRNSLPSPSEAELMWANTANRLPDKDDGDVVKDNLSSGFRAKRRLKLTTQLMQQLIPPLSSRLMHGSSLEDNECATYSLAKLGLEDACRLVANTQREASSAHNSSENKNMPLRGQQGRTWGMAKNVAVMRCVESFMERAKRLDSELARVDSSLSVSSELGGKISDLEKMAIVNRLARHHGTGFTVDSSEICVVGSIPDAGTATWKPSPKKYVTAAPMPRTLPGVKCLSL